MLWAWLSQTWSDWRPALVQVKPATVLAWHRRGFLLFWTWKSRHRLGHPTTTPEIRALIRRMATANPLWGAPRIHGELQKLGISLSQSTVAKYMPRRDRPPSQPWRTFLANHLAQIMAADFFVVPTVTYRLPIRARGPRARPPTDLHVAITDHPTAAWTAQQLRNTFPEDQAPGYVLHDRDAAFTDVTPTIAAMQIHDVLTAPRPGRTRVSSASLARSDVSASTTSSYSVASACSAYSRTTSRAT
jgi:putative transposase